MQSRQVQIFILNIPLCSAFILAARSQILHVFKRHASIPALSHFHFSEKERKETVSVSNLNTPTIKKRGGASSTTLLSLLFCMSM